MAHEVWIYNPDDEPDDAVTYGGHRFVFPENSAIQLQKPLPIYKDDVLVERGWEEERDGVWNPNVVAAHVLAHLGQWGVCVVGGPVTKGRAKNHSDQAAVDAAEAIYLRRTTEWAAELMQQYAERSEPFVRLKLPAPARTAEEEKAHEWWEKNRKRVSD